MSNIHYLDLVVVALYFASIIYIGRRAKSASKTEEGYFLAGRKLGKLYQIFLTFGNATEPQGAVTTASFVYQRGASGAWYSFQTIFLNPYYWFMNVWFRRVRLLTMADLFEDRFDSRGLARFYALFQVGVAILLIGFGSFTAYTITASLATKPEAEWSASERASVAGFFELRSLEQQERDTPAVAQDRQHLEALRERRARGELDSKVSVLAGPVAKYSFYVVFMGVVAAYMVLGGMTAAAFNEALQGTLVIAFSIILIPTGIHAIGGWAALGQKVPTSMFGLFGSSGTVQFSAWTIFAITLPSLIQMNALSPNMNIMGSAKNEFAARMGVVGFYGKRVMIILWTFAGLIAIALFSGEHKLPVPDSAWGMLSRELLGPGLIGLMLAGVIAAVMSNLAAKSMAVAALFVKNFCRHLWPGLSQERGVFIARWTIIVVLGLGLLSATTMNDMESIVRLIITVNVPFGAAIQMMFFWRRVTASAVWVTLILCVLLNIVLPLVASKLPAIRSNPALTETAVFEGRTVPLFFDSVVHSRPEDVTSPLEGRGRFNVEAYLVSRLGLNMAHLTPNGRLSTQYLWDALFPFLVLIGVSLATRDHGHARVDQFYGKMKTPVGQTPELEAQAMEETRKDPHRFDQSKLFGPNSSWEFGKWDRADAVGFVGCCGASVGIIAFFTFVLRLASGV